MKHGGPRRLDFIAVPKTWLAATVKSLVLEHFDAYTIIYDHKPVAVEIKGSLISTKKKEPWQRCHGLTKYGYKAELKRS